MARIAYHSSDVILSVQPSLAADSIFSSHFKRLASRQTPGLTASEVPEVRHHSFFFSTTVDRLQILPIRHNVDPFLSAFHPLRRGKSVSVTTTSSVLLQAIPHLYKLAQYPITIHVALHPRHSPDYSEITAIRETGFIFLHSETLQEAQDIALSAHALANISGKGVIHFFDVQNSAHDKPIRYEDRAIVKAILSSRVIKSKESAHDGNTSLYADEGRQVTITEDTTPIPKRHSNGINNSQVNSQSQSKAASRSGSSVNSPVRENSTDSNPASSSVSSLESVATRPISSIDIHDYLDGIWAKLESATGRSYNVFEYTGPEDAESALFVFGATGLFVDELERQGNTDNYSKLGIVTARVYRPWLSTKFADSLPLSIKRIAVLEQFRRKTVKWGPVLLDVVTSLKGGTQAAHSPRIIGYQLKHIELATVRQALKGILQNLLSPSPIQNLEIGSASQSTAPDPDHPLEQPEVESAYLKILNQVFDRRLHIANRQGSQNAGVSPTISASPEYGLGALLARIERRNGFIGEVQQAAKSRDFATDVPRSWLSRWALSANDPQKTNSIADDVVSRLSNDGSALASSLLSSKSLFFKDSQWLIGSDAWAYDLGNSGVHHVLASNANINMLIIDSQPYSERAAADAARRKKDIGLYAMNYGNAYVASVAVYSSYTQVLEAMIEADKFDGPSVVLAYLPYNQENESPLTVLQETKKAVDLGYWPLYRWNPNLEEKGEPNFQLDSEKIKKDLEEFLKRDNHLTQLTRRDPKFSPVLSESYGTEVRALQKRTAKDAYEKMLEGLYGAPLTILFASDNGNAESLSKRLANRGKARGLKTMVFAMDDYPVEDLSSEENVVLITSTAGQGEFPQNGRAFWEAIKESIDLDLSPIHYAVFALGDSHYWPRKEDRIFYNKPGKDLDAKVASFGGKRLAECGLGDDQDPDGYQTGYGEWEPKLWQALGVDKVEGLPEEPPPITNEDIKIESNFLRGTIAEGLEDKSTGAIAASDQQLTKFHGTYMQDDRDLRDERKAQGLEPAYSFMIRCRLNGGVATPSQWLQMDQISSSYGNETMKLTTRQTFQFHGVVKGKLKPAMRSINKALMTTLAACGDVNRNVMCSTIPTRSRFHKEVHQVSAKISDHLLPATTAYHEIWLKDENDPNTKTKVGGDALLDSEPLYGPTYLPRKFKITIAIPPHNDTDVYAHDVGLIAIKSVDGDRLEGFNVLAGGGMGVTHNNKKTYPRTGSMLGYVPTAQVHVACEKIMLVQRDHGDRKNRKHARLKYTIDDMGVDVFRGKVEELLGFQFDKPREFHFDSNIDTFGWQRDELGMNHFTFFIENGRVEDTADFPMKTGLREIAKMTKGEFRLTGNQHLCLSNVPDTDLERTKALMKQYKLDNLSFSALRLSSSACVAFPTCGLAMAESERYLPELITKLEQCLEDNGLRQDSIVMRMTGCPNGCARPWLAEVAFVGKAYGAYNMYLGGGYHGERLNKLYRSSIGEEEILEIMTGLLGRYAKERDEGEHFGDFVIRVGVIKPTTEGKTFHEDVAEEESDEE